MGNVQTAGVENGCFSEPCVSAMESFSVVGDGGKGKQSWLRAGERRWVPDSIYRNQLLYSLEYNQSWVLVDSMCVLYGESGVVIGAVGPHALSRVDGVSLDFVNGVEVFNICLARVSRSVKGIVLIAMLGGIEQLERPGKFDRVTHPARLPGNKTGPCTVHLARAMSAVVINGNVPLAQTLASAPMFQLKVAVDPPDTDSAVALLALHSGLDRGKPWHLEAVGKNMKLAIPVGGVGVGKALAAAVEPITSDLAYKAANLTVRECPQGSLPDDGEIGTVATVTHCEGVADSNAAEELAVANRLAGEKRREADAEHKRAVALQSSLTSTQESLRRVCGAVQAMQYELEAWRREALLKAQQGNTLEVAAMLDTLPSSLQLEGLRRVPPKGLEKVAGEHDPYLADLNLLLATDSSFVLVSPSPQHGEDEDPKLRTFTPRAGDPFASRPPAAKISDALLPIGASDDGDDRKTFISGIAVAERRTPLHSSTWPDDLPPPPEELNGVDPPPPPAGEFAAEAATRDLELRQREVGVVPPRKARS